MARRLISRFEQIQAEQHGHKPGEPCRTCLEVAQEDIRIMIEREDEMRRYMGNKHYLERLETAIDIRNRAQGDE